MSRLPLFRCYIGVSRQQANNLSSPGSISLQLAKKDCLLFAFHPVGEELIEMAVAAFFS